VIIVQENCCWCHFPSLFIAWMYKCDKDIYMYIFCINTIDPYIFWPHVRVHFVICVNVWDFWSNWRNDPTGKNICTLWVFVVMFWMRYLSVNNLDIIFIKPTKIALSNGMSILIHVSLIYENWTKNVRLRHIRWLCYGVLELGEKLFLFWQLFSNNLKHVYVSLSMYIFILHRINHSLVEPR